MNVDEYDPLGKVFSVIRDKRLRRDKKWGEQNHHNLCWLAILVEEVGELSKQLIEQPDLVPLDKAELVQVAAVAVAWLQCLERNEEKRRRRRGRRRREAEDHRPA